MNISAQQVLKWLCKSIDINQGAGSSAYYHLWKGWAPPYPETSGYLIETLLDWGATGQALSCANWLCSLQRPDGAFPGGLGTKGTPLVFDSGMILFGLIAAYQHSGEDRYLKASRLAAQWLTDTMDADGHWRRYNYVPGYSPAYHSRIVWALLKSAQILNDDALQDKARLALQATQDYLRPDFSLEGWGFRPGEAAFTHTIAYTLRGWLESSLLIQDQRLLAGVAQIARRIVQLRQTRGRLGGRYDANWQADESFICITGHAQLSCLMSRLYECSGEPLFRDGAQLLFQDIANTPCSWPMLKGAIPGSWPWWGAYQPWRFPNWAAKFYLEAAGYLAPGK